MLLNYGIYKTSDAIFLPINSIREHGTPITGSVATVMDVPMIYKNMYMKSQDFSHTSLSLIA